MSLNVPLWEHPMLAPFLEEARKIGEASARALDEQILGRLDRTLLPVEALDKRQRARLSGYMQMHQEVSDRITSGPRTLPSYVAWPIRRRLEDAAFYYGNVPERPTGAGMNEAMQWELSKLSGHPIDLVAGVIADWCFVVHGNPSPDDWRRIWTGE